LADILGTNFVGICFCWVDGDVGSVGIEIVVEIFCS